MLHLDNISYTHILKKMKHNLDTANILFRFNFFKCAV